MKLLILSFLLVVFITGHLTAPAPQGLLGFGQSASDEVIDPSVSADNGLIGGWANRYNNQMGNSIPMGNSRPFGNFRPMGYFNPL